MDHLTQRLGASALGIYGSPRAKSPLDTKSWHYFFEDCCLSSILIPGGNCRGDVTEIIWPYKTYLWACVGLYRTVHYLKGPVYKFPCDSKEGDALPLGSHTVSQCPF